MTSVARRLFGAAEHRRTAAAALSDQGRQLFVLLHEIAHVNGTVGFVRNDGDPTVNSQNNDKVWEHCSKAIGK
jgi:hypothetical protein